MPDSTTIFNRRLLQKRRDRAADHFAQYDFLMREAADRLADRLEDMARDFPLALDLGCHTGVLQSVLAGRGNIHRLIQTDVSPRMLEQAVGERVACDEEWLPFADESFDLVMSVWSLHWVNDLPGTLIQIRRILKPDGLFLCVIPGANSLFELRQSLAHSEAELVGGMSPRVAPFVEVRDAGALLQRAGFSLPVVDSEMLTVTYENALKLMHDLRGMGEGNHLQERQAAIPPRMFFAHMAQHYAQHFIDQDPARIVASFELLTMTAWSPHHSQQQPARRGSGTVNLEKFLQTD